MQISRHLAKELVTKYFSMMYRRFEYVWLRYSYVGLWFTVRCDGTQEDKVCEFQQQGSGNSVPTNSKAESLVSSPLPSPLRPSIPSFSLPSPFPKK